MDPKPSFLRRLLGRFAGKGDGLGIDELARRLGVDRARLESTPIVYRQFTMPKRTGGQRVISAPDPALMDVQRAILHRLLSRRTAHEAAHGFERGRSIVTHARLHAGRAAVVRLDVRDFFPRTGADRVRRYFRAIGWSAPAADLLARLCTHTPAGAKHAGLPQGAPTSPRLSNLLNTRMDERLDGLARSYGGVYSRYADDLCFSFDDASAGNANAVVYFVGRVLEDYGYRLHTRKKRRVMRSSQRQTVTGLVVNEGVRLPREVRRWLRAVEHRQANPELGKRASLTPAELQGWRAYRAMVEGGQEPRRG